MEQSETMALPPICIKRTDRLSTGLQHSLTITSKVRLSFRTDRLSTGLQHSLTITSYRYIDDLISFNNKRFKEFISDIYPKELTISETTESTSVASYLDLLFMRDRSNNITTKLYDKRDAFGFHIVNFPFMSSNIPSAPAYGVYASQLVRYARCCSNYSDFLIRHRALVKRLLSQGYKVNRLSNTFKKFYGRHTDLVGQYKKNVCQMFADSIS